MCDLPHIFVPFSSWQAEKKKCLRFSWKIKTDGQANKEGTCEQHILSTDMKGPTLASGGWDALTE